ncbi:hypothetical protein H4R33_006280 [Dimargaris cristalligena]|nr:hypothetical protein H4R33_006280 [Dimargaris cristalligena]
MRFLALTSALMALVLTSLYTVGTAAPSKPTTLSKPAIPSKPATPSKSDVKTPKFAPVKTERTYGGTNRQSVQAVTSWEKTKKTWPKVEVKPGFRSSG